MVRKTSCFWQDRAQLWVALFSPGDSLWRGEVRREDLFPPLHVTEEKTRILEIEKSKIVAGKILAKLGLQKHQLCQLISFSVYQYGLWLSGWEPPFKRGLVTCLLGAQGKGNNWNPYSYTSNAIKEINSLTVGESEVLSEKHFRDIWTQNKSENWDQ